MSSADVLGAVGRQQQELGARIEGGLVVEQHRTQERAARGAAGLEGLDHIAALGAQPPGEDRGLRALAAPLAAFEHDEHAAPHSRG